MTSEFRELEIIDVSQVETYLEPGTPNLSLHSPAILFMTDFIAKHPVVVDENSSINAALNLMKQSYVRLLLVVSNEYIFRGIITAADISGGKVLSYMSANQLRSREDVRVKNIMTDRNHIHALQYEQLQKACIGDVVATIKHIGEQHVMVVQFDEADLMIRGMYSTTDIAQALHIEFDVEPHAKTFFELNQVILHHGHISP
jgi:CBS-domain-containing membrane protein